MRTEVDQILEAQIFSEVFLHRLRVKIAEKYVAISRLLLVKIEARLERLPALVPVWIVCLTKLRHTLQVNVYDVREMPVRDEIVDLILPSTVVSAHELLHLRGEDAAITQRQQALLQSRFEFVLQIGELPVLAHPEDRVDADALCVDDFSVVIIQVHRQKRER